MQKNPLTNRLRSRIYYRKVRQSKDFIVVCDYKKGNSYCLIKRHHIYIHICISNMLALIYKSFKIGHILLSQGPKVALLWFI